MYRVIQVVYTRRRLSALKIIDEQKKYLFICEYEVKIGDMIESPTYVTPCQVVDIFWSNSKPMAPNGQFVKTLVVDKINGQSVDQITNVINSPEKMKDNSMFSGIMSKYTGQFIPEKEDKVRMSLNGLLCVPQDGEYVGIDNKGVLVQFPVEMTLPIPVYSIVKQNSAIVPGDIIKNGNSYSRVKEIHPDGSLKILSFTGFTHNKQPVTDFIMGTATTRVLINMFNFDEKSGFNPIFFAMANGDTIDVNSLVMLSMTPQGKNLFSNAGGGFNPMMLWMLDKNRQDNGGGMDMMTMMMMSSAMGGQNPLGNIFGQQPAPTTRASQTVVEAINTILSNPDAIAQLKNALKTE